MSQVLEQIKNRRSIRKYKPNAVTQELLKSLGIEGEYEGIGHCALGYIDGNAPKAAPRKENRVFYIK